MSRKTLIFLVEIFKTEFDRERHIPSNRFQGDFLSPYKPILARCIRFEKVQQ